jgi:hypothetical protein
MRLAHVLTILLASAACTSHEGHEPGTETPASNVALRATIASVMLSEDCPDKDEAPAQGRKESAAKSMERVAPGAAMGDSPDGSWSPPCSQSSMQITISHDGKSAMPFEVKAVRLTAAGTGALLGTVPYRKPSRWTDDGRYEAWDQSLAAGTELKVSYKLGLPDWNLVAKAMDNDDTYGQRFVLEVDIAFAGRTITVRSPEFEREYPHRVVT